jgi:translation initiation factor 1 (eIF-1/SUI1)
MSERFVRLPGSARRYIDTLTGEEISRRQYIKITEGVSPESKAYARYLAGKAAKGITAKKYERRLQGEKTSRVKPFPESKKLPDEYFLDRKKTHRWFMVRVDPRGKAPKRANATQRFQVQVVVDYIDPKTNTIYPNVRGYSSITYKWWYNFDKLLQEAFHSASYRCVGKSTLPIYAIKEISIITRRFLTRSKRNYAREKQVMKSGEW